MLPALWKSVQRAGKAKACFQKCPLIIILSKKEKMPLILFPNCSRIVFIGSSFRMNASRGIEFPIDWYADTV